MKADGTIVRGIPKMWDKVLQNDLLNLGWHSCLRLSSMESQHQKNKAVACQHITVFQNKRKQNNKSVILKNKQFNKAKKPPRPPHYNTVPRYPLIHMGSRSSSEYSCMRKFSTSCTFSSGTVSNIKSWVKRLRHCSRRSRNMRTHTPTMEDITTRESALILDSSLPNVLW